MMKSMLQIVTVGCYFGVMLAFLGAGVANLACVYNVAPSDLQAYLPAVYGHFAKTGFMKNAMKMCGIATAPQLMKVMGFAHIASVMSIFFQPIVGAMWMLITMIGAEYVSRRALEIPGMPNADLCGKASPTCMATVLLTGTPVCKYCVQVFGASKKDKSE
ncbi:hypothetical protein Pmar_PMAR025978 [Perkinsus marinus ATCC 50983]|uniref:Uncharacterized protein n=1 Tax=Perkinsus marinus (strain ATCC 50983 / TXsc) TaxID=423536 RepID=C5L1J6_PERM5|nr:hypothetical protein Pmar_PMAR025978 [Perkinsus marinus ATCC 50983]EER09423.1 hypothetical protein Pmar_PMAR025978 [Perkinsus marinus ATCC 50983]|eukprot:XP_002777607.1 hypothetical protein Pmar_PMAR025978 [Perkinsus marinus ATCC 50983]